MNAKHSADRSTTFVLVHGAWHGGWCWRDVASHLAARGHTVYAPTLTGVGERSHLVRADVNLTTHVLDVVNEVTWKDLDDIVLCGHSYGGMVITGAVEQIHERVRSIVYVDAFLPQNGQCLYDIFGVVLSGQDQLVPPIPAEQLSVNPAHRDWVNQKMTPQSGACFSERLTLTGAVDRLPKRTYVLATQGTLPPVQATYDRIAKNASWKTHAVNCGHDIMIDKPIELAEILLHAI